MRLAIPRGTDEVFQINHCHVAVPGAGQEVLTKDRSRTWLQQCRLMDTTGSLTASVREKATIALSGCDSLKSFMQAHAEDNLSFPLLASVRAHLAKRKDVAESQSQAGAAKEPTLLTAVLVEAEDQDVDQMPTRTLLGLQPVLKSLAMSTEELKVKDVGGYLRVATRWLCGSWTEVRACVGLDGSNGEIGAPEIRRRIPLADEEHRRCRLRSDARELQRP